jgi:mannose-6-phosphate isomerase-like protein (cupin superfamily)
MPYTHLNLDAVEDAGAKFGLGDIQEARFANADLGTEQTGLSHYRIRPGQRQPFGHRHDDAEEVYVVLSGSGRVRLGDDVLDVRRLDAVRVSSGVMRAWEAGPDGLELLAFGPKRTDDRGELVQDWWTD